MTRVYCGLKVSQSGKGMTQILLLLLLHVGVSTIATGGVSWILLPMLLHTRASAIRTCGNRREYCIESTVRRYIKTSFTE